jgi:phosphonate transport system ATP-binding protein
VSASVALAGVGVVYADGSRALEAIDLHIERGERVAVIGPSGAGKTTLLRVLATALRSDRGAAELLGQDPWALSNGARQQLRARIGLIHQSAPLPPRQRVVTAVGAGRIAQWSLGRSLLNLVYPLDINGVRNALGRLDLDDKLFARCDQLSGGQLQRVSIARVLYQAPELLLADEPVASMDPVLADHTLAVLRDEAQTRGIAFVASLHAVELALRHFDRIIGLREGRIVFDRRADAIEPVELAALYANEKLQAIPAAPAHSMRLPLC